MLHHNLLIILRSFKRFKTSFLINLVGLSTGLASVLLVYLWVTDELQVDKFHVNDARLYELFEHQKNSQSGIRVTDSTPGPLGDALLAESPEVEAAVTATSPYWFDAFTLSNGENTIDSRGIYASRDYFKIFSFDLLHGDVNDVLADKKGIVISEETAMALFSTTENLIGKGVEFQHDRQFIISGIMKNLPSSSSTQFDFVISFEVFKELSPGVLDWRSAGPMTYVLLKEKADVDLFDSKIARIIERHSDEKHRTVISRQYSDIYLYGNYNDKGIQSGGRIEYVIMFSIIAAFILVIACINFMNLSTAQASRRIKEVGIKKSIGAGRRTLIFQYMGESMLMSFLALFLAILMVDIFLPQFNLITGKQLSLDISGVMILAFFAIAFITGLVAGSYPALYLSAFNPAVILKGKFNTSLGELWARKGLVVFQFSLSVVFIVAVLVVYKQIQYLQNKNIGYDKDNMVYFTMEGKLLSEREVFLTELRNIQGVEKASSISESLVGGGNTTSIGWAGKSPDDNTAFAIRPVNYEMLEMLNLDLVDGRFFDEAREDSMNVIFNETAISTMGMKDPIGKTVTLGNTPCTIVGVVKDFNYEALRVKVQPLFFVLVPQYTQKIMVRIAKGDESQTIERIAAFYKQFNPGFAFDFRFLDQDYQSQYEAEKRVGVLSRYFAGMAILISCLGLFGLAAFTAERRVKEIGIRKVLGSSDVGIIYLLSVDFTKIVLLAIVLALPVSYLIVGEWLANFAYKIPLHWSYFLGSGFLALFIAWITVAGQAMRASRNNPVASLRSE